MPYKPGETGNPEGGNHEKLRRNKILREKLMPEAERLFKQLMKLTRSSDESIALSATKDALDRLYGKAQQHVELSGDQDNPIAFVSESPLTSAQFLAQYAPEPDEPDVATH